jgi:hypothetical protein
MNIFQSITNVALYRAWSLEPQVDLAFMRPIIQESMTRLLFYNSQNLRVGKKGKDSMYLHYSSSEAGPNYWINATTHVQVPRKGFERIDFVSCMKIHNIAHDPEGRMYEVLERIIEEGCIEKVMIFEGGHNFRDVDFDRLRKMRGKRHDSHVERYGWRYSK